MASEKQFLVQPLPSFCYNAEEYTAKAESLHSSLRSRSDSPCGKIWSKGVRDGAQSTREGKTASQVLKVNIKPPKCIVSCLTSHSSGSACFSLPSSVFQRPPLHDLACLLGPSWPMTSQLKSFAESGSRSYLCTSRRQAWSSPARSGPQHGREAGAAELITWAIPDGTENGCGQSPWPSRKQLCKIKSCMGHIRLWDNMY